MAIFTQIHEMIFHGNGGYDYMTIYNMPVWLRKFTWNKLKEHYDAISAEKDNLMINEENPNRTISRADVMKNAGKDSQPTYNVKARKK